MFYQDFKGEEMFFIIPTIIFIIFLFTPTKNNSYGKSLFLLIGLAVSFIMMFQ
jgi:hypothetical protein